MDGEQDYMFLSIVKVRISFAVLTLNVSGFLKLFSEDLIQQKVILKFCSLNLLWIPVIFTYNRVSLCKLCNIFIKNNKTSNYLVKNIVE